MMHLGDRGRFLLAVLMAMQLAACEAERGGDLPSSPVVVRDSVGVQVVENRSPAQDGAESWRLVGEPVVRIGSADGAPDDLLFRVAAARLLEDDRMLVANGGSRELRWYDFEGRLVGTLGGEGQGPGEFLQLQSMETLPHDSIGMFDPRLMRYTVSSLDGTVASIVSLPDVADAVSGITNAIGRIGSSLLAFVTYSIVDPAEDVDGGLHRPQESFVRVDLAEGVADTIGRFLGSERIIVSIDDGAAESSAPRPFGWGRLQAVRGEHFLVAYSERMEVLVYSAAGELEQIIRAPAEARPVTAQEQRDYLEARRDELDDIAHPTIRALTERILEEMTFPPTHPVLDQMVVDRNGRVWIGMAASDDANEREWRVFDRSGRWLGVVMMPTGHQVLDIDGEYVLAHSIDELGVEYIEVRQLAEP